MSRVYAPLQFYNLLKSCMIVFLIQALAYIFLLPIIENLILRLMILFLNLFVSVLLGWRLYKRIYHMVFTYDDKGFTLKKGRKQEDSRRWNEFSKVSLFRTEEGSLSVRLYKNGEFFDLPASKLKLNPFDFRLEIMRLVDSGKGKK